MATSADQTREACDYEQLLHESGEEILFKRCKRDCVLRYLMEQADSREEIKGIEEGNRGGKRSSVGMDKVLGALLKKQADPCMPQQLRSLLNNPNSESLLQSLVFARLQQIAKLDSLEAQILLRQSQNQLQNQNNQNHSYSPGNPGNLSPEPSVCGSASSSTCSSPVPFTGMSYFPQGAGGSVLDPFIHAANNVMSRMHVQQQQHRQHLSELFDRSGNAIPFLVPNIPSNLSTSASTSSTHSDTLSDKKLERKPSVSAFDPLRGSGSGKRRSRPRAADELHRLEHCDAVNSVVEDQTLDSPSKGGDLMWFSPASTKLHQRKIVQPGDFLKRAIQSGQLPQTQQNYFAPIP